MSDWRLRHNNRMLDFFFPEVPINYYPTIVPYCAMPNYNSLFEYELEDLINKKYMFDLHKMFLKKDNLYPGKDRSFRKTELASKIIRENQDKEIEIRKKRHNDYLKSKLKLYDSKFSNKYKDESNLPKYISNNNFKNSNTSSNNEKTINIMNLNKLPPISSK